MSVIKKNNMKNLLEGFYCGIIGGAVAIIVLFALNIIMFVPK